MQANEGSEDSPLVIAQQRVAKAALTQPMNPQQATISSYVNGILQSCRVDALTELYLNPPNETWSRKEALEAAILRALTKTAELLEKNAAAIQVAQSTPKLHLVS